MDEDKFELMYRFPGGEDYIPLPSALDYLYWTFTELQDNIESLERENQDLRCKLDSIQSEFNSHISNHN